MCDKTFNTYPSTIKFVPECFRTQEVCDELVNRYFLYLILFLISIKPKKCVSVVSEDPFLIVNFPDKYKAQRMCDETANDSLAVLKLTPDWFLTSRVIKKLLLLCTQMKYTIL